MDKDAEANVLSGAQIFNRCLLSDHCIYKEKDIILFMHQICVKHL